MIIYIFRYVYSEGLEFAICVVRTLFEEAFLYRVVPRITSKRAQLDGKLQQNRTLWRQDLTTISKSGQVQKGSLSDNGEGETRSFLSFSPPLYHGQQPILIAYTMHDDAFDVIPYEVQSTLLSTLGIRFD